MRFEIDFFSTSILVLGLIVIGIMKLFLFSDHSSKPPSLFYSRLEDLKYPSWRSKLSSFPKQLRFFSLICLILAFIDPHFLSPKTSDSLQNNSTSKLPAEGLAIYLDLDQSGSMAESVTVEDHEGNEIKIAKIDLLKQVTKKFILAHPSDLIGLISFARVPKVLAPLTLDQNALLEQLKKLQVVKTLQEDGTAIGYAIFKAATLLSATRQFTDSLQSKGKFSPYQIKSAIVIVVTDGFQDPSRLDLGNKLRTIELDDAAVYAKKENVRVYVVNIDPALSSLKFAPERKQLQKITSLTGGKFFMVGGDLQLEDVYEAINKLEKGTIVQHVRLQEQNSKSNYTRYSLYPYFIITAMAALFTSLFLDYTFLRRIP